MIKNEELDVCGSLKKYFEDFVYEQQTACWKNMERTFCMINGWREIESKLKEKF